MDPLPAATLLALLLAAPALVALVWIVTRKKGTP